MKLNKKIKLRKTWNGKDNETEKKLEIKKNTMKVNWYWNTRNMRDNIIGVIKIKQNPNYDCGKKKREW